MANIQKTFSFVNGQPADATQVNKDFDDVIAGVGDLATLRPTVASLGLDADIATLVLPANTTITAAGAAILDDADAAAQLVTLGAEPAATAVKFACGSYTGNAAANRTISVGFQPKLVVIWSGSAAYLGARIDATDGESVLISAASPYPVYFGGAVTGLVLSATGFVTGTNGGLYSSCNVSTAPYKWEAWG
jgi:hypothetical protein